MNRLVGWIGLAGVLGACLGFAWLNSAQRVTVRLGVVTLYGVPLTVITFVSVLVGMCVMLGAGIRSDLKVRRILRARLIEEDRAERERFVDRSQSDLFTESSPEHLEP